MRRSWPLVVLVGCAKPNAAEATPPSVDGKDTPAGPSEPTARRIVEGRLAGENFRMCAALPEGVFCRDFLQDLKDRTRDGRALHLTKHGDVVDLDYDDETVCGRRRDGPAMCWPLWPPHTAWVLSSPKVATAVAIAKGTACAIGTEGDLWCGEIGEASRRIETPDAVSGLLAQDRDEICVLTRGGRPYCGTPPKLRDWFETPVEFSATVGCSHGAGSPVPQCGWSSDADAEVIERAKWTKARRFPDAVEIDGFSDAPCVVLADGRFDCTWTWSNELFAAAPKDGRPADVIEIEQYGPNNCVLTATDEVWCKGSQIARVLGRGSAVALRSPTRVREQVDEVMMRGSTCARARGDEWSCVPARSGGTSRPSCGIRDGAVICRRFDIEDRILDRAVELAGNPRLGCARRTDKRIWCWAERKRNDYAVASTRLRSLEQASLQIDGTRACALEADGTLWCWGEDACGRLGTPGPHDADCEKPRLVEKPTRVPSAPAAAAMAVGSEHTCVLTRDRKVACVGDNSGGQLGDGSTTSRDVFAEVPGLTGVRAIAASGRRTCAVLEDRSLSCWGWNLDGELGNGRLLGWSTYARWPTGPAEAGPLEVDEWSGKPTTVLEWRPTLSDTKSDRKVDAKDAKRSGDVKSPGGAKSAGDAHPPQRKEEKKEEKKGASSAASAADASTATAARRPADTMAAP